MTNLRKFYDMVKEGDREDWYQEAHNLCKTTAQEMGVDFDTFTRIVAVMSPSVRWEVNVKAAKQLVEEGDAPYGYAINREKAARILAGQPEYLQGPKVTRFYESIIDPDNQRDRVVVDRWAYRAYIGNPHAEYKTLSDKEYKEIEQAYIDLAEEVGVRPGELQAWIWSVVRRMAKQPPGTMQLL